ncbi:hypothetical protein [Streptomyces sp. NPDC088733]|uniref:hypothetical protein n=1 Tax=Streptomyces sp. NPDC088733 TaxID=3365880 RepID=UPI00381031C4
MSAVVGVDGTSQPVWRLNLSVLFEDAEPNTTAEFAADLTMVGPAAVHESSAASVEDFMGMVAQAINEIPGRACYVTLDKVSLLNTSVFAT